MKKNTFILLIIIFIIKVGTLKAQKDNYVSKYIDLDTIIDTKLQVNPFDKIIYDDYLNDIYFTNYKSIKHNNTILFYKISKENYSIDTFSVKIDGLKNMLENSQNQSFKFISINDKYLILGYFKNILLFNIEHKKIAYLKQINLNEVYNYAKLISSDTLILGKIYNNDKNKSIITIYNLKDEKLIKCIYPSFDFIEFSHFLPQKWIDAKKDNILFSQTVEYKIDIYNNELKKKDSILKHPINWETISSRNLRKIDKKNKDKSDAKHLINLLREYERVKISRIYFSFILNSNTIAIIYNDPKSVRNNKGDFFIDILKKDSLNKWNIVYEKISDYPYNMDEIVKKDNMYLRTEGESNIIFDEKKIIMIIPEAPISPLNKKWKEFFNEKNEFYNHDNPEIRIYVFKHKFCN